MGKAPAPASCLSQGEQRALASFLAGRLPAGRLHEELCRAREQALEKAAAQPALLTPQPALHAA